MGIQGLLPQLKSIMQPIHLKELEGCCVAVDTYSWLHKGALSCSKELCKGLPTTRHIDYCMHRVNLLRHYGVKPILVFDGGLLPMKIEQENKRARARKENLERAIKHESDGNSSASYECYQKAVDISPSIAYDLIQVLKKENVSYVVAPYEADAQMTFLAVTKQADAVITEDSDLIPFGCSRIIYKMDKYGQGVEFRYCNLHQNRDLSFTGFSKQMVLEMCILSGCDYLQSLPGMGLKKAHALVKKFRNYDKVIKHLRYNTTSVPPAYEEMFRKAILTFQHQRVYDPISEAIVHLFDLPDHVDDDLEFLGPSIPQHIAKGIAEGDLDPITKLPFEGRKLESMLKIEKTIQPRAFKPVVRKTLDFPAQKNLVTKYFCVASIEAKKEFKAPRITTTISSPDGNLSPSPDLNTTETTAAEWNINTSNNPSTHTQVQKDSVSQEAVLSESPPFENTVDMVKEIIGRETSLLRQSTRSVHKPCSLIHNKLHRNCSNGTTSEMEKENGKVVLRSRFFQNKPGKENKEDSRTESPKAEDGVDTERETCFSDGAQDNLNSKRARTDNSLERDSMSIIGHSSCIRTKCINGTKSFNKCYADCSSFARDTLSTESETKDKFGSNISHLERYSSIAEQSMERFVSAISSFKYTGSGSRASGLRAPLREVKNNDMTNRSKLSIDISQFAYLPKDRKTSLASRKG